MGGYDMAIFISLSKKRFHEQVVPRHALLAQQIVRLAQHAVVPAQVAQGLRIRGMLAQIVRDAPGKPGTSTSGS